MRSKARVDRIYRWASLENCAVSPADVGLVVRHRVLGMLLAFVVAL